MKPQIVPDFVSHKSPMVPFIPGRRTKDKERAFFVIFSTMIEAGEIARLLPDLAIREKVLETARDSLLRSFRCPQSLASDRQGLSRWRGGRFACTSLRRQWSLERLTVGNYDDVNMASDVSSISMSINNRLLVQLLSIQQLPTQSRFKSHSSTRPPQTPAASS